VAEAGRVARSLGGPGYEVVEKARDTIHRYGMLEGGEKIVVAVSGGPDSTCLLDVLARLSHSQGYKLEVAHVDHRLSPESETISARVAKAAAEIGYDVHVARAPDLAGPNLHARARDFRYAFFETIARDIDASKIATGHTLDDRVETTLARLVHGASTDGLAGIPPAAEERIRPLIGLRRSETRAYCDECGLDYVDDPANDDDRFDRAAVRSLVVTAIEERWGDGAIRAIAAAADDLRDDADALRVLADRLYGDMAESSDGVVSFDRTALLEMPRAFRRRMLERAIGRVRDRSGGIDAALVALDQDKATGSFAVATGFEITLTAAQVLVSRMPE
jgi:tRNA(Ile)-lysidine synthase